MCLWFTSSYAIHSFLAHNHPKLYCFKTRQLSHNEGCSSPWVLEYLLTVYFCSSIVFAVIFATTWTTTWITPHAARPCRDLRASPGEQANCYLLLLSPSKYLPFCWGQGSRAKKILFCSTPFLAPHPNSNVEILARNGTAWSALAVAWGIQPEAAQLLLEETPGYPLASWASLLSQISRWYCEGCNNIGQTPLHPQTSLLTSIDSTW